MLKRGILSLWSSGGHRPSWIRVGEINRPLFGACHLLLSSIQLFFTSFYSELDPAITLPLWLRIATGTTSTTPPYWRLTRKRLPRARLTSSSISRENSDFQHHPTDLGHCERAWTKKPQAQWMVGIILDQWEDEDKTTTEDLYFLLI